jgi:hypothetical protein
VIGANYELGIDWIAVYDRPHDRDVSRVADRPSVRLLAELFDTHPRTVAMDVVKTRQTLAAA